MRVSFISHKTPAFGVKVHILPPFVVYCLNQVHQAVVVGPVLQQARIAVDALQEAPDGGLFVFLVIEPVYALDGAIKCYVVKVQPAVPDMRPEKLKAALRRLVIEFLSVELHALCFQACVKRRDKTECVLVLQLRNNLHKVVHKTGGPDAAVIIEPAHLVVYVEAHALL